PDVREAAVALWQIDDRELLLGFYVSDDMSDTDSLKGFLRQSLPRHMVPNRLIARERLPRLSNGKLDRGALIQGMESETHTISGPAAESDAIQVAIGHIWCRLLKIEKVTSADDFFELGGDSLLGVQMLLELRRQFDLDVQISALFGASQLYQLAKLVRDASTNVTTVAPIRRQGHKPAVFCVHARTEFLLKTLPEEYPVYLVFRDLLHQGRRLKSIQEVAALYVSDLLATQSEGPYYLLGFSAGGMIAYEMANQLIQAGHQVDLIALADPPPFVNMSAWRFRLYRKLFHMRMAGGVWKQMLYLFRSGPGILGRMMSRRAGRVMNRLLLKSGKSMSLSQIEFGILQRYVQLGKTYRYPELPARCEVFVTDSHPRIVEDMRRQWRDLNGSRTTVSVINGAEKHLDLMHQSHGTDLARQFVDALVSTGGNRGQT
ncbi:MAG: thioesterase domain-containing protein, partial [Pseudomonadota bacterium]